jgi:hypothetical protein
MDVETRVAGMANATSAAKEPSDVKFTDLLVGTFNVQGYLFLEELQAEDGTPGYFDDVGEVRPNPVSSRQSLKNSPVSESSTGEVVLAIPTLKQLNRYKGSGGNKKLPPRRILQ